MAAIFLLPFFGTLIYLIARPTGVTPAERDLIDQAKFAAEKARVLGA